MDVHLTLISHRSEAGQEAIVPDSGWTSLYGPSSHTIDGDGRLIIPQRMRGWLGASFVLTRGVEKSLWLLRQSVFEKLIERWADPLSLVDRDSRVLDWRFVGQAVQVSPDRQNRVVIPSELRMSAGVEFEVIALGLPNRVELWDPATWRKYEAALAEGDVQQALNHKFGVGPPAENAA